VLNTPVERIHNETDSLYGLIGDPPKAKLLPANVVKVTKKLAHMKEMEVTEFAKRARARKMLENYSNSRCKRAHAFF
jgi:Tat protein secretion system quality control protein TatD with DNase activity